MLGALQRCSLRWLIIGGVLWGFESRADTTTEAQAEAARIVSSMVLTLPDGTSMAWNYRQASFGVGPSAQYWHHSEFKWAVIEEPLTPADRLNGLTWKGTIKTTIAAYRKAHEREGAAPCWFRWDGISSDHSPKWSLWKVWGQWETQFHSSDALEGNRLPTQEIADRALKFPPCPK
jgi:hypothetical protein